MENQIRRTVFIISICIFGLTQVLASVAQTKHPGLYIDKGICPGEGCSVEGRAKVLKRTTAAQTLKSSYLPLL